MIQNEKYFFSTTDDLSISACSTLIDTSSAASIWGYYFCFENNSDKKIRLIGKSWNITDARGNNYYDGTEGFKGEIPEIEPGEYYEFISEIPLSSEDAVFYGSCKVAVDDEIVDVKMPTLSLSVKQQNEFLLN